MIKTYYTAYVQHMIRFYRHSEGIRPESFHTEADRLNWEAVESVISHPDKEVGKKAIAVAMEISDGNGFIKDKVSAYCENNHIGEDLVWQYLKDFERKIARVRGLI